MATVVSRDEEIENLSFTMVRTNFVIFTFLKQHTNQLLKYRDGLATSRTKQRTLSKKLKKLLQQTEFIKSLVNFALLHQTLDNINFAAILARRYLNRGKFLKCNHQLGLMSLYPFDILTQEVVGHSTVPSSNLSL